MTGRESENLISLLMGLDKPGASNVTRPRLSDPAIFLSDLGTSSRSAPAAPVAPISPNLPPLFLNASPVSPLSAPLPTVLPGLASLAGRLATDLETNPTKLLGLNRSRREAITLYLDRLAGILPTDLTRQIAAEDGLRRWIHHPRTPAQTLALKTFFEEVAWLTLAQALVLKSWSDRGIRSWSEADLGRLNWALSMALKPHVPLDRDGWQITSQNFYSWYTPDPALQREIWRSLESWRISEEGPELLVALLRHPRATQTDAPEVRELRGYDSRFFKAIWEQLRGFGLNAEPRRPLAFSPTLRSGAMVRSAPENLTWIGFEHSPFQLMVAELIQLWWGPSTPPCWASGNGLDAHSRDQLSLSLCSPKPSLVNRIAEMEACDLSVVLEERTVRLNQRNGDAALLRQQLECLPYFKKIRGASTSLGTLQACVALNKLRPGGQLWWTREEAIRSSDGAEALGFLLDKGRLICEWDFSSVEHALPSPAQLFPKYLYLFVREPDFQRRLDHRPIRVTVQGQIRSHIELPIFLSEALQVPQRDLTKAAASRPQWQIHAHQSPVPQKEWSEKWPDPAAHEMISALEALRQTSSPLASFSTIRPTPAPVAGPAGTARGWKFGPHVSVKGLWIRLDPEAPGRLRAEPLPAVETEVHGQGFLILVADETWTAPLCRYLESEKVRQWIDHHAERKGEKIILTEQLVKFLPVPKSLLSALAGQQSLPGDWERMMISVSQGTPEALKQLRTQLAGLPTTEEGQAIRTQVFVRAARLLEHLYLSHQRVFAMVGPQGRIRWRELLNVLPKTECTPATYHPELKLLGQLPPHMSIGRIDRVKAPAPGILFATENGMTLTLVSEDPRILDMLWEQVDGVKHPTWNEISQWLRLPRRMDVAMAAAEDVLRAHGTQTTRAKDLESLIQSCHS